MSYVTALIFDFEREGTHHKFKFYITGETLQQIRNKAKALQNEIQESIFDGKPTVIHPIKFELGCCNLYLVFLPCFIVLHTKQRLVRNVCRISRLANWLGLRLWLKRLTVEYSRTRINGASSDK